jgi:hypothetical protein
VARWRRDFLDDFLIPWFALLPNTVRLILKDDVIGQAATTLDQDANLYKALFLHSLDIQRLALPLINDPPR